MTSGSVRLVRILSIVWALAFLPLLPAGDRSIHTYGVVSSLYCNPYTTTRLEKVGRYTCPLATVGAANFA